MILTFYSYKGGVGRSMALANIAQWYYLQGKRVIIADWDLEAPGLEGYFHSDEERLKEIKSRPGIIDMLEEYKLRFSKFKLEVTKAQQEVQSIAAKLLDEFQQTEIDWEFINDTLNSYALFQKEDLAQIKNEISELSKKPEVSIANISKILKPRLDGSNLANTISLNINNKIQEDYLDLGSIGIYLSTYSLFKKEDVPNIIAQLQKLAEEKLISESALYKILSPYIPAIEANENAGVFLGEVTNLQNYLQPMYLSPSSGSEKTGGVWLLSAGSRQEFTDYAKKVQNFNWTEFYTAHNGEHYFEWLRNQLIKFADVILIDSRTGVSEMSGVSTRQLADTIVIITAPNPQNLTGAANMVKSFVNEEVKKARNNRDLKVVIIPSRIDVSESALLNKFQATFYRTVDDILPGVSSKTLWELGIPYIPYYNYIEEKAVGISDQPEELENTGRSPVLDKAYRSLASFLVSGNIETETLPTERSTQPFIGLRSFEQEDASLFFGRTVEISRMIDIINKTGLLILSGPPGSGKSSLLRAGLIPLLRDSKETSESSILWFRPGTDPFSSLAAAIASEANKDGELKKKTDKLTKLITAFPNQLKENIHDVFAFDKNYIFVIDQFEEVFTLCQDPGKREAFINALVGWISNQQTRIAVAVRSDFYPQLSSYTALAPKLSESFFNLGIPSERELRQIISEPAIKAGLKIEQGLPERILKDLETVTNKLPVLQTVLYELWTNRSSNVLTHASYDRINRVDGVLRQMFEENYKAFSPAELNAARPILTRLIDVKNQTRQKISLQEINPEKQLVLRPFIDKGLLSVESNEKIGAERIELSHDSLISSWPQLKEWMNSDREFLLWRQQLTTRANEWKIAGKTNDFLLGNTAASEANHWIKEREADLFPEEMEFIKKSVAYRDNQRQTRLGFLIIGAVMIVIFGIAYFNRKASSDPVGTTIDTTQTKAYEFARKYSAESNPDLDFNLKMLKEYYQLDKPFQDSLKDIRQQIENNISYKFFATIDGFYSSLRNKTFDANSVFTDTVQEFGSLKKVLSKDIQAKVDGFYLAQITNHAIDTSFQFSTDSAGYYITYEEESNALIDASMRYEEIQNTIKVKMDDNFKINSLIYLNTKKHGTSIKISPPPTQMRVDLFSCGNNANEGSISRIMAILKKQNFNVVRRSFKNPVDPQSPYYVNGNEIRYNGNEEYDIAKKLKLLLEQNSNLDFYPKEVRTITPNIISVFICGEQTFYFKK